MDNISVSEKKNVFFTPISNPDVKIQRYCPHMGEDLQNAEIVNNMITCPRHGWVWDITTGKCLNGGNLCLHTEKLEW
jgi:UDP-MurNAc hydroxylase